MAKASVSLQGQGQGGSYHQIFLFGERGKKKTTKKATLGLVGPPQTKATWVVAWVRKHAKWDRVVGTVQPIMCQRFNQGGGSRVMEGLLSTPKLVLLNKCPPPRASLQLTCRPSDQDFCPALGQQRDVRGQVGLFLLQRSLSDGNGLFCPSGRRTLQPLGHRARGEMGGGAIERTNPQSVATCTTRGNPD